MSKTLRISEYQRGQEYGAKLLVSGKLQGAHPFQAKGYSSKSDCQEFFSSFAWAVRCELDQGDTLRVDKCLLSGYSGRLGVTDFVEYLRKSGDYRIIEF